MIFREAVVADIPQIQVVRNSVTENTLSNPDLVPDKDVEDYITNRGKGWVCEVDKKIVGFSGELKFDTSKPDGTPRKLMDVSKLHSFGWKHKIDLEEGITGVYSEVKDKL